MLRVGGEMGMECGEGRWIAVWRERRRGLQTETQSLSSTVRRPFPIPPTWLQAILFLFLSGSLAYITGIHQPLSFAFQGSLIPRTLLSSFLAIMAEPITHKAKEEINTLADKDADSTDDNIRYMAYGARLRTALRAGHRYIAYVRLSSPFSSSTSRG